MNNKRIYLKKRALRSTNLSKYILCLKNMCKHMSIISAVYVYIQTLVHKLVNSVVAKNVTPDYLHHIITPPIPQTYIFRRNRLDYTSDTVRIITLSTATTTTIFKLVTIKNVKQKKSSLTIIYPKSLQLKLC
jgi:hypothetical protein